MTRLFDLARVRPRTLCFAAGLSLLAACPSDDGHDEGAEAAEAARSGDPAAGDGAPAAETLPTAEEVLAAHVEASGGQAAIDAVRSVHLKSEIEMPARGVRGQSEMWWSEGRFRLVDTLEGIGVNEAGFDGERLWVRDAFNSLRDLEGKEAELYRRGSSPFLVADWREHFESAETLGRREAEGRELIDLELRTPLGQSLVLSFDAQTKLLAESSFDEVGPTVARGQARKVITRAEDYRSVGPLRLAHRQVTRSPRGEVIQRVVDVELDVAIDPARFEHPSAGESVQADPSAQPAPVLKP